MGSMFNFNNINIETIITVPVAAIIVMNFCDLMLLLNNISIALNIKYPIIRQKYW